MRFTFEEGDWQGWRVIESDLQEAMTNRTDLPNHPGRPFNKQGDWFLLSGNREDRVGGDDALTGVIESPSFELQGNRVSFLIGGGAGPSTYVALLDANGEELIKANGSNGPTMKRVVWDTTA